MSFARRSSKSQSHPKPAPQQLPPSLASELLMMQFMGGGSIERNAKRIMEQQARDIAPAGRTHHNHHHHHHSSEQHHHSDRHHHDQRRRKSKPSTDTRLPLGEVYRDERGNMWWDEHEAAEFRGLLTPTQHDTQSQGWVNYDPFGTTAAASPTSTTFSVSNIPPHHSHHTHHVQPPYSNAGYPSYADPGMIPYGSSAPPRRRGSAVSPAMSGFEDSFVPPVVPSGYIPHTHVDPVIKKKTLRGRARALFGGH
ncbi:hypothetical protein F5876DRAFT_66691 [Lentinula aff. lateritia]|uniref:Uncharacterized protein n=1 Tax=Lentinula aff. lateritia TaxID=2804960 RepID=A0ACC1TX04_9AGAR|nr:hypothetical protein F5876DRAFT_66691 [Lentinula aff. lateritia]